MECGRQIESTSFTHDEAVAGIWCLVWHLLAPKGCQEIGRIQCKAAKILSTNST